MARKKIWMKLVTFAVAGRDRVGAIVDKHVVDLNAAHSIGHNKVMIIDGKTVITGSFNFTKAAEEKNAENFLVIRDKLLAEK
jgi:phosphatidylserine/phosphatidylglycerophosphate/cardiolipin synthase-like enzyme